MQCHFRPCLSTPPVGARNAIVALVAVLAVAAGCAPTIKRDLSKLSPGQVGYDDLCGLQKYFDSISDSHETPPPIAASSDIEGGAVHSGRTRFRFETGFQLDSVRTVLNQNWDRLPADLPKATSVQVEVRWSDRGGLRRVVTNESAILTVGARTTDLPYHVCLSDLLFGEPIYRQRRQLLGLAPRPPSVPLTVAATADGGAWSATPSDAGDAGSDTTADGPDRGERPAAPRTTGGRVE